MPILSADSNKQASCSYSFRLKAATTAYAAFTKRNLSERPGTCCPSPRYRSAGGRVPFLLGPRADTARADFLC